MMTLIYFAASFITFFFVVYETNAASLPDYIQQCSLSDPDFENCVIESGNKAIPVLTKGDRKYRISPMNPMFVPLIDLSTGGLRLLIKDANIYNLENIKMTDFRFDRKNGAMDFKATLPSLLLTSQYEVSGQILVLPVRGNGPANISLDDGIYFYSTKVKTIQKKGEEYYKAGNSTMKIVLKRATFKFDNLFNGDVRLGDHVNRFANENWEEVLKEMQPAIELVTVTIIDNALNGYLLTVPKREMFKP